MPERISIGGQEGKIVERREESFPSDPEDRMNAILASVNTEPKNIALAWCLDDRELRTSIDMKGFFDDIVEKGHWRPHHRNFYDYSHQTFAPIGTVAEEQVVFMPYQEPVSYFKLTEAGMKFAVPLAKFALWYAVENEASMSEYLGKTGSSGETRSPTNRVKILKAVLEGAERKLDVAEKLERSYHDLSLLYGHLKALSNAGLIFYDSVSPSRDGSGWSVYEWIEGKNPDGVTTYKRTSSLTRSVAEALAKAGRLNRSDLKAMPEFDRSAISTLSGILSHLAKTGFARPVKYSGGKQHSEIALLSEGRAFYSDFVETVEAELKEDGNGIVQDVAHYVDGHAQYYAEAGMDLYEKVSPNRNRKTPEKRKTEILSAIKRYQAAHDGQGPRPVEIAENLGINLALVDHYLRSMREEGCVERCYSAGKKHPDGKGKAVMYVVKGR